MVDSKKQGEFDFLNTLNFDEIEAKNLSNEKDSTLEVLTLQDDNECESCKL